MRDDQHRVFVIRQVVLQPRDRRPVEVVGRLVEQQVVGFAEQGLRQPCISANRSSSSPARRPSSSEKSGLAYNASFSFIVSHSG